MTKKVIFFFAGTAGTAKKYKDQHKYLKFDKDVVRIYISGCQDHAVGGGRIAYAKPNLDIIVKNLISSFEFKSTQKVTLNLNILRKNIKKGIITQRIIIEPDDTKTIEIDQIAFEGYSRGAVTTFAIAKKLSNLMQENGNHNKIIDIVANQPVTGDLIPSKKSRENIHKAKIYAKYSDISDCNNIRSVTTMYAMHENDNSFLHRYYTTMKPKTNDQQIVTNILLPQQIHLCERINTPAPFHIAEALSDYAELNPSKKISTEVYNSYLQDQDVQEYPNSEPRQQKSYIYQQNWYKNNPHYFTPYEFSQKMYGTDDDYRQELNTSRANINHKIKQANLLLTKHNIEINLFKRDDQKSPAFTIANAICNINETFLHRETNKQEMLEYMVKLMKTQHKDLETISNIINKVTDVCLHLTLRTKITSQKNATKHQKI